MSLTPYKIVSIKQAYTLQPTDEIIEVREQTAGVTIALPSIAVVPYGQPFIIRDAGSLAATYNIVLEPDGAEQIMAASNYTMDVDNGSLELYHDGIQWMVIASHTPAILTADAGGTGSTAGSSGGTVVRIATTTAIADLAAGAPSSVDGVTLVSGNLALVKNQSTGSQNGIYSVTTVGSGSNGVWVRASAYSAADSITAGMQFLVAEGTTQADTEWVVTTDDPIIVGTDAITFSELAGGSTSDLYYGNGNKSLETTSLAGSSNRLTIANTSEFLPVTLSVESSEASAALNITQKGAAKIGLGDVSCTGIGLRVNQPLLDANDNELITWTSAASAVNNVNLANSATGNGVSITAVGGDATVNLSIAPKGGAGVLHVDGAALQFDNNQPINSSSGTELLKFTDVSSAVNEITITNAATATSPKIAASGSDTNIEIKVEQKGTAEVILGTTGCAGVRLANNQPIRSGNSGQGTLLGFAGVDAAVNYIGIWQGETGVSPKVTFVGTDTNVDAIIEGQGTGMTVLGQATSLGVKLIANQPLLDSSGNELIAFTQTGGAVNQVNVTNCGAGSAPIISTSGGDTNIPLRIRGKGTAFIYAGTRVLQSVILSSENTAGDVTYSLQNVISNILDRDPNGAARADTTPTAATIITALVDCEPSSSWELVIRNQGSVTEDITLTGGSGVTINGTAVIAPGHAARFLVVIDNANVGFEAITFYNLGSYLF